MAGRRRWPLAALPPCRPSRRPTRTGGPPRTGPAGPPPALVVVGVAATLAAAAANALGTFLVDSSVAAGLGPGLAGLTLTLGSAVCVAARVGAGWLADRRASGHVALIAGMLVVGAAGLAPARAWPARCRWWPAWCSASGSAGPGPG